MILLSKLVLNPREKRVRRDLADCHELHRTLMRAFPQAECASARAAFGLLYRVEINPRQGRVIVLVQSQLQPDWSSLPQDYLLDEGENSACKAVSDQYSQLQNHMRLRFRLRANPTRRISSRCAREKNMQAIGKRVEIRSEEEQIKWLMRKGEVVRDPNGVLTGGGFHLVSVKVNAEVANVRVTPEDKFFGRRADKPDAESESQSKKHRLTFGSVLFEGVLEITDAERFQKTLEAGIGSGKAYGFGLLSIAPV